MEECAEGEPGLLLVKGDNIMSGYIKNPTATKEAIHGDGWYVTQPSTMHFSPSMFIFTSPHAFLTVCKLFSACILDHMYILLCLHASLRACYYNAA
jgi:acyl-CoA synthetase (AMP-forming)/AMP-acid ligase II